MMDSH